MAQSVPTVQTAPPQQSTSPLPQPNGQQLHLQGTDPATGQVVNIDINSNSLSYNSQSGIYTVTGDVYIIVPQKGLELLADKATYNPKTADMVATGNVFIITKDKVIGSVAAQFDLKKNVSFYAYPRSVTNSFRIRSQSAIRTEQYIVMQKGRAILEPQILNKLSPRFKSRGIFFGPGAFYSYYSATRKELFLSGDAGTLLTTGRGQDSVYDTDLSGVTFKNGQPLIPNKPISPRDVAAADFNTNGTMFQFKSNTVDIHRLPKGFDEITFKRANFSYRNMPLFFAPRLHFGYNEKNRFLTFLGPDLGYSINYGGLYGGPSFSHPLFDGWFRVTPILTYGGGYRNEVTSGKTTYVSPKLGIGILAHYRSPENRTDFQYGSTLQEPTLYSETRLFGRSNDRLRFGVNQYYGNGFFGSERPLYIGELADYRQFNFIPNTVFRTFASADIARDNFSPTRQQNFFVSPRENQVVTTERLQLQWQLINAKPLVQLGHFAALGAMTQGRTNYYGTGDTYTVLQGGPYATVVLGPVFNQFRYMYTTTAGASPFVFDTYYFGRNSFTTVNSIDLTKYVTVGAMNILSLSRDNAKNALLVDQQVFISIGSKNIRFSLAFDTIQKRSFFGVILNPQGGNVMMDFNHMNVYQPGYNPRHQTPLALPDRIQEVIRQNPMP